jgi:hypothetical protein
MGFIAKELDAMATWTTLAEGTFMPVDAELRDRMRRRFQSLSKEMITLGAERPPGGIATAFRRLLLLDLERRPLNAVLRIAYYLSLLLIPWRGYVNAVAQDSWTDPRELVVFASVVVMVALPAIVFFSIARLIHFTLQPIQQVHGATP